MTALGKIITTYFAPVEEHSISRQEARQILAFCHPFSHISGRQSVCSKVRVKFCIGLSGQLVMIMNTGMGRVFKYGMLNRLISGN